jgi:hypothetical protein
MIVDKNVSIAKMAIEARRLAIDAPRLLRSSFHQFLDEAFHMAILPR